MKLDKHVVDMFTELTKPADDVKMEKTCYGTISVVDGTRYVKLDGSDLLVPAASTVKTSHGDRVTVLMKNHSLTVTGNLTAPATDGEGGSSGEAGTAATIEVGTVTTGEAGSSASVTNSGTTSAAVFDFVIPRGDKGEKGDTGPQGPQGEKGDTGTWDGTIPDHEHTVSDITDFPTSLPANGGNADTVGAKSISQILAVKGWFDGDMDNLKEQGSYIVNDATNMPIPGGWGTTLVFIGGTGSVVQVFTAYVISASDLCKTYIRHFTGDLWSTWVNIADGGNADTLDEKHADDFSQIINLGHTFTDTKNALGIQYQTTTYWCSNWTDYPAGMLDGQGMIIAAHYNSYGTTVGVDKIWCRQIFISPHPNTKIYQRILSDSDVGEWTSISDGGNADTVDGKHAESFMQWLGNISDVDFLNNANYKVDYHCNLYNGALIGLPIAGWYHIVYYMHIYQNGFGMQIAYPLNFDGHTFIRRANGTTWGDWKNVADGGNADTLDGKHADEFLYANGFAGQLAKLFSQPANDDALATVFSVAPDNATLDTLNPGIYVVNTSAARKSLKIPNELSTGGPGGSTIDNVQCVGGILIKLGNVLGKPGIYADISGHAKDRPFTTSCAFFISNKGSIYWALEAICQATKPTGEPYIDTIWTWKAFVFNSFSDANAYSIQSIKYIDRDVTLAPGGTYVMYATALQFTLPYTSGTAYGPTKSFPLKSSSSNPNLCIVNTSSTKNLIIPAGRYLIHAK